MKVLYLAPHRKKPEMLSAFTFVDEEIRAIAAQGLDVYVLTYPLTEALEESDQERIYLLPLPSQRTLKELLRTLAFLWQVKSLVPLANWLRPVTLYHTLRLERCAADGIRDERIDVIHSNFGAPNGFGGVLAKAVSSKPLVTSLRGMDVLLDCELGYGLRMEPGYDAALRVLLRNADSTTHVSQFIRKRAIELGADANYAKTVLKGVDCHVFNGAQALPNEDAVRPVILTVAGLIRRKGIHTILEALGRLVQSHDFSFVVVGEGPELMNLRAQCDRLSLTKITTFEGFVTRNRIARFFAACDIFVLGSALEASGNVLLEAMASARPVVCTDSGGPTEYVVDGKTGFVVPVAEPEKMAEKIKELLDDSELRARLGRQGRTRAVELFSYARMVNDIVATYENAIERNVARTNDAAVAVTTRRR